MADLPFVDTHFHLHDMKNPKLRYSWLEADSVHPIIDDIDAIKSQKYRIQDYVAEIRFSNVTKAVHVQAALGIDDPVEETRWVQGFADEFGYPQAIIAECRLAQPDAPAVLERHLTFPNMRGVRDLVSGDRLADPAWQAGFGLLGGLNLSACIDVSYEDADHVLAIASRHLGTPIVLDHCLYPRKQTSEYFSAWAETIRRLAQPENIHIKISGLGMFDLDWTIDSLRPWVLECIDAFGPARTVFGTNWPVDRLASSYPDLINAYDTIISGFSQAERQMMFSHNAERIFRI